MKELLFVGIAIAVPLIGAAISFQAVVAKLAPLLDVLGK